MKATDNYEHFAVISGTGKNLGKTSFALRMIKHFSAYSRLRAIKTSNHFHPLSGKEKQLVKTDDFLIVEEMSDALPVDSSRFLKAGASSSFFIMHRDAKLPEAINALDELIDLSTDPVVMESGAVLEWIKPGVSIYLYDDKAPDYGFDRMLTLDDIPDFPMQEIRLQGIRWRID